jgi:hypothetical protein
VGTQQKVTCIVLASVCGSTHAGLRFLCQSQCCLHAHHRQERRPALAMLHTCIKPPSHM